MTKQMLLHVTFMWESFVLHTLICAYISFMKPLFLLILCLDWYLTSLTMSHKACASFRLSFFEPPDKPLFFLFTGYFYHRNFNKVHRERKLCAKKYRCRPKAGGLQLDDDDDEGGGFDEGLPEWH